MKEFKGKNCFITGAASGIGRSFALVLGKLGMNLYITDINIEGLKLVKNKLENLGVKVFSAKCDVSRYKDFEKIKKDIFDKLGDLDLLINNAGIAIGGDMANPNLDDWKKVIDTNLWSMIYSIKIFLPQMITRKSGHIVTVSSGAGILGSAEPLPYIASKFAIVGLSESYYARLKNLGVNVSVVVPSIVRTNIWNIDISKVEYDPRMLKDHGKKKLDEVYKNLMNNVLENSISADNAVEKYIEGIRNDKLYIFDNEEYYNLLALKGTNPKGYEEFLIGMQTSRSQNIRDIYLKYGIKLEDYV